MVWAPFLVLLRQLSSDNILMTWTEFMFPEGIIFYTVSTITYIFSLISHIYFSVSESVPNQSFDK